MVQLEWHHRWYDATVLGLWDDETVRVHYDDLDSSYGGNGEDVSRDRILTP